MKYLLALLGLLYTISPYDLFPDLIIGWGWIDDLIVLGLLWWYFSNYKKKRYKYKRYFQKGERPSGGTDKGGSFREEETTGSRSGFSGRATSKDPYTVLGVGRGSSAEEIKRAYRRLANKYHPDKVNHMGEEFRELAERRFKEIQEAYRELMPK
ncbi:MAG: DnaJ domain-containing protein [Desulfobacteraceae bacterium]|nr:MAG: DnaJ domain-containing protein [Desulfobacteraceae bacterium]